MHWDSIKFNENRIAKDMHNNKVAHVGQDDYIDENYIEYEHPRIYTTSFAMIRLHMSRMDLYYISWRGWKKLRKYLSRELMESNSDEATQSIYNLYNGHLCMSTSSYLYLLVYHDCILLPDLSTLIYH